MAEADAVWDRWQVEARKSFRHHRRCRAREAEARAVVAVDVASAR
jgi:hypothetical protein